MAIQHVDVAIVGAGLSGVGMGCHLQTHCPDKSYAILEARGQMGGTWDLFRYPGIRSDSDMYSLGYKFRPWDGDKTLADGPSIRAYIKETAADYGVDKHIRFHQQVKRAEWSSKEGVWTVETQDSKTGKPKHFTCNFLQFCAGYYSYKGGHKPPFPQQEAFKGKIIYPQEWPQEYDVKGKTIIVIGSGATAVTLVPAMAQQGAKKVIMLQRSPTYVVSAPEKDKFALFLKRILPERWAASLNRRRMIYLQDYIYRRSRTKPEKVKDFIFKQAVKSLPEGFDVEKHFQPAYNPWDQRMCLIPDDDLFNAIAEDKAEVITDHIDHFTKNGIRLKSGRVLQGDAIVSATGLELVTLGEAELVVDGKPVDLSQHWIYKGMMYSGVPNLASTFGYINASWTLRSDLQAEFICRVINEMDAKQMKQAVPCLRAQDAAMPEKPFVTDFSSGYIQRAIQRLPKQSDRKPWINLQNYRAERAWLMQEPVDDGVLQFSHAIAGAGHNQPAMAAE